MTAALGYSTVAQLLVGDLVIGNRTDPQVFVNDAAAEIDSELGYHYVVPILQSQVPAFVWNRIVKINNHIASGRLIMALDQSAQKSGLHAYADTLVMDALRELFAIRSGELPLPGVPKTAGSPGDGMGPSILVYDRQSGVDTIYDYLTNAPIAPYPVNPYDTYWRPGPRGGIGSPPNPAYQGPPNTNNPVVNTGYTDPTTGEEIDDEGHQRGTP